MNLVFKRYNKTLTHWNLEFVCIFKCNTKVCCVEYIFHSSRIMRRKFDEDRIYSFNYIHFSVDYVDNGKRERGFYEATLVHLYHNRNRVWSD
jgi:hypothetical protein